MPRLWMGGGAIVTAVAAYFLFLAATPAVPGVSPEEPPGAVFPVSEGATRIVLWYEAPQNPRATQTGPTIGVTWKRSDPPPNVLLLAGPAMTIFGEEDFRIGKVLAVHCPPGERCDLYGYLPEDRVYDLGAVVDLESEPALERLRVVQLAPTAWDIPPDELRLSGPTGSFGDADQILDVDDDESYALIQLDGWLPSLAHTAGSYARVQPSLIPMSSSGLMGNPPCEYLDCLSIARQLDAAGAPDGFGPDRFVAPRFGFDAAVVTTAFDEGWVPSSPPNGAVTVDQEISWLTETDVSAPLDLRSAERARREQAYLFIAGGLLGMSGGFFIETFTLRVRRRRTGQPAQPTDDAICDTIAPRGHVELAASQAEAESGWPPPMASRPAASTESPRDQRSGQAPTTAWLEQPPTDT